MKGRVALTCAFSVAARAADFPLERGHIPGPGQRTHRENLLDGGGDVGFPAARGEAQGRVARLCPGLEVGPLHGQLLERHEVARGRGEVGRREPVPVGHLGVRPQVPHQQADRIGESGLCGGVQRGAAVPVGQVHPGPAAPHQQPEHLVVAPLRRQPTRGHAPTRVEPGLGPRLAPPGSVRGGGVCVGPVLEEGSHSLQVAQPRRQVQRRVALGSLGVGVGAHLRGAEQPHGRGAPLLRRRVQRLGPPGVGAGPRRRPLLGRLRPRPLLARLSARRRARAPVAAGGVFGRGGCEACGGVGPEFEHEGPHGGVVGLARRVTQGGAALAVQHPHVRPEPPKQPQRRDPPRPGRGVGRGVAAPRVRGVQVGGLEVEKAHHLGVVPPGRGRAEGLPGHVLISSARD
mmetsp:Transcript_29195/g.65376  ORF Transcript_29195/g.65376 Transcript_29195/m.65376 type:complete len:402 (+) Transcript_29195:445-1650(+)